MRLSVLLIVSAVVVGALPTLAVADAAQGSDTSQASATNPDEIVCKMTPAPTGSRLGGGRECHSQREWDQHERDARKALEDKQMHGLQSCIGPCGG